MTALLTYAVCLVAVHAVWAWCYLAGTLLRAPGSGVRTGVDGTGTAVVEIVVRTAAGAGLTVLATFVLGLSHLLYPLALVAPAAVGVAVFALRGDPPWRATFWRERAAVWRRAISPVTAALYVLALGFGFLTVAPDLGSDATSYHAVYALDWAQAHALVVDPTLRLPYYANNWLLLDVWLLQLAPIQALATLSWLTALLSLWGVYGFTVAAGERSERPAAPFAQLLGLLAAASLALSGTFVTWSLSAMIDGPIGFAFLACALAAWNAIRLRDRSALADLAVCGGLLCGMKISLIAFAPALAAALAYAAWRTGGRRAAVVSVLVLAACTAPWYARNFILAGDPVSPVLNLAFRGADPAYSRDDLAAQEQDLHAGEGGVLDRILVPLDIVIDPSGRAFRERAVSLLMLFIWVPAAVAYGLFRRRAAARDPATFTVAALVAYAVAYWMSTSSIGRYALVFLPAFAALAGAGAVMLAHRAPRLRAVAAAGLAICAIPTAGYAGIISDDVRVEHDLVAYYHDRASWMPLRAPGWAEAQAVCSALRSAGRTDLTVYRSPQRDRLFYQENGVHAIGDFFGSSRFTDFVQAIFDDRLGPFLERRHVGAVVVARGPRFLAPPLRQRLQREMAALGFRRLHVTDAFDVFLSSQVRG